MRFLVVSVLILLFLITIFRLFSSHPSKLSHSSFQPAYIKLNQPQNPVDQIVKKLYPEPQASLLSGILVGTKANMPPNFYLALQRTGTLHLIALSGQNISLVISLISYLLTGLGKKISSLITIITIIIFILFVGPSASVVRAGLMGSLTMVAIIFGRQSLAVVGLLISGLLMFIASPQVLFDIGFQLSFCATLGILLLASSPLSSRASPKGESRDLFPIKSGETDSSAPPRLCSGSVGMTIVRSLLFDLKTTLSAQLFTMPIVLFNFHNLSLVAPLSNVLILWSIPYLMYGGFAIVVLSLIPLISSISLIFSWLLLPLLNWFVWAVQWTSVLPFASFTIKNISLGAVYLYYGILFLVLSLLSSRVRDVRRPESRDLFPIKSGEKDFSTRPSDLVEMTNKKKYEI